MTCQVPHREAETVGSHNVNTYVYIVNIVSIVIILELSLFRPSDLRHRDWHKAFDDLLEEVDNVLKSKESLAATNGSSPPTTTPVNDQMNPPVQLKTAQELQEFQENRKENRRSTSSLLRRVTVPT